MSNSQGAGTVIITAAVTGAIHTPATEIIVSTRRGTFIFWNNWNNWKRPGAVSSR